MNLADRLFNVTKKSANVPKDALARLETEKLLRDFNVPFDRIGWDYYDESLEIHGVEPSWRMPATLRVKLAAEGFSTVFVNHTDGWETHYGLSDVSKPGWRVSYPHRRVDSDRSIWVEAKVDGWPQEWFDTGYVVIVKEPT